MPELGLKLKPLWLTVLLHSTCWKSFPFHYCPLGKVWLGFWKWVAYFLLVSNNHACQEHLTHLPLHLCIS